MHQPHRRHLLAFLATSALYFCLPLQAIGRPARDRAERLTALERASGGRLGVHVLDTGNPASAYGHRSDERFGMCSTFKLLLAGMVLQQAEAGLLDLERPIRFGRADLVPYAPVIEAHLETGELSIAELARAAQTRSDNVAANLLLRELGGPETFTSRLREWGDAVTRLDRIEPSLNLVPPGELRDTSTPRAMAESVARLVAGDLLGDASRQRLRQWLIDTDTGLARLRRGFPSDWVAGDKTGTAVHPSMPNRHNDVAVVWPPDAAPLVIAAFYEAPEHFSSPRAEDEAVLADVGRVVARASSQTETADG